LPFFDEIASAAGYPFLASGYSYEVPAVLKNAL
jgi:hypothetical protein